MRNFEKAYGIWRRAQFPSGGHWDPTAQFKADLAYADVLMREVIPPWVEVRQTPGANADLAGILRWLEELRNRAIELRDRAQGENSMVAGSLLKHNELLLEVYKGFLESLQLPTR
jgi:hypothetical protein